MGFNATSEGRAGVVVAAGSGFLRSTGMGAGGGGNGKRRVDVTRGGLSMLRARRGELVEDGGRSGLERLS